MGSSNSKEFSNPQNTQSVSAKLIHDQIKNEYKVELPHNIIQLYIDGNIKKIKPFIKTYKTMTDMGCVFSSINVENDMEVSSWVNNDGTTEKRGWKL